MAEVNGTQETNRGRFRRTLPAVVSYAARAVGTTYGCPTGRRE